VEYYCLSGSKEDPMIPVETPEIRIDQVADAAGRPVVGGYTHRA
jgi:hypothetical protein